jgi:hypothetical protein
MGSINAVQEHPRTAKPQVICVGVRCRPYRAPIALLDEQLNE